MKTIGVILAGVILSVLLFILMHGFMSTRTCPSCDKRSVKIVVRTAHEDVMARCSSCGSIFVVEEDGTLSRAMMMK